MNQTSHIGYCGSTPELKQTNSGKAVCNFRLAVSDGYGEKKKTIWLTIQCWEKTADVVAKHLSKGDQVGVAGKLQMDEYEKDGQKVTKIYIQASNITFLGKKETPAQPPARQAAQQEQPNLGNDDDIPF